MATPPRTAPPRRDGIRLGTFIAGVTLAAVLSFLVARQVQLQSVYGTARENNHALCSLRRANRDNVSGQAQQVAASKAYNKQHPDGAPALGLTHAQLERSVALAVAQLARARKNLAALSRLHCSPGVG